MKQLLFVFFFTLGMGSLFAQKTDSIPPYSDDEIIDNNTNVKPGKTINGKMTGKRLGTPVGLFVGSNVGFSAFRILSLNLAPYVGYRIGKTAAIGVGFPYTFNYCIRAYSSLPAGTIFNVYGIRAFAKIRPFGTLPRAGMLSNMYLHLEGEYLTFSLPKYSYKQSGPSAYVGLGWMNNFEKGWGFTTEILFNVLSVHPTLRNKTLGSAFQYRIGFCYNF